MTQMYFGLGLTVALCLSLGLTVALHLSLGLTLDVTLVGCKYQHTDGQAGMTDQ